MKKMLKLLGIAAIFAALLGVVGCDDGSSGGEAGAGGKSASLYRLNTKSDCDFDANGVITNFNADGSNANTYLYYPHQLNLESDNVVLQAKVNFSDVSAGRIGVGVISVSSNERDGYAFATASQKVRYGKSSNLDPAKTENGQGWNGTAALSSADGTKCDVGTDYIFRVTLKEKKFVFEIFDTTGETVLATKDSGYNTYFTTADKCYLAIGAQSGNTNTVKYSEIKATVNGTSYTIDKIEDIPDRSGLTVNDKKIEVNKDGTKEIEITCLDKKGDPTDATVETSAESIATATYADGKVTISGVGAGTAEITITNSANTELKAKVQVSVVDFVAEDPTYIGLTVYPKKDAASAYEDGEWMIGGFTDVPVLNDGGRIKIYEVAADNTTSEVDTIEFADEAITLYNQKFNVRDQLVRVDETAKAVYFTPHIGKIENGKKYLVAVPQGAITGTFDSVDFTGLTNDAAKSSFVFTTRAKPTTNKTITVDGKTDSTANFRTIQGALNAIGATTEGTYKIEVAKGTYRELLYFKGKANVIISGQGTEKYGADVIVQYDNATCINGNEKTRNLLSFVGGDLVLENITLKNTLSRAKYGKADTQAEALGFDSDTGKTVAAYNCSFLSHQDTIRIIQKGFFYDCYIVGDVDFIWGETNSLACVIEKCKIESVYEEGAGSNQARILASKTGNGSQTTVTKGFVILNSEIICGADSDTVLGRTPWSSGTINQCAVINSEIKGTLNADRWEGKPCSVSGVDLKYVGWKEYGNTGSATPATAGSNWGLIDATMYQNEYSGRRAILNRVINIKDKNNPKFEKDAGNLWDIDKLISDRSWTCDQDDSKVLLDDETEGVKSYFIDLRSKTDGTYKDSTETVSVVISGASPTANDHGAQNGSATISLPAGTYGLLLGTCQYGTTKKDVYTLTGNEGTTITKIASYDQSSEAKKCYCNGNTSDDKKVGDFFLVSSDSAMTINVAAYTSYLSFVQVTESSMVVLPEDNKTTSGTDLEVTVAGSSDGGGHGPKNGTAIIKLPAGTYALVVGTCKYAAAQYELTCTGATVTHVKNYEYETENCYKAGGREAEANKVGDVWLVSSASNMEISVASHSNYMPFVLQARASTEKIF